MFEKFYDTSDLTVAEYVQLMFAATKDGTLHIPHFNDALLSVHGPIRFEEFNMTWTEKDVPEAIANCENLITNIEKLANLHKGRSADDIWMIVEGDPVLQSVYERYLAPLDDCLEDTMVFNDLRRKRPEDLDDEDWAFYDEIITRRIRNAQKRIGGKLYAYDVAEAALHLSFSVDTDETYLKDAEQALVKAVVLNQYAV